MIVSDSVTHQKTITAFKRLKKYLPKAYPQFSFKFSKYINSYTPIRVYCKSCKSQGENPFKLMLTSNLLKGVDCVDCYKRSKFLTEKEYKERLEILNPYVTPIEKYRGLKIPIKHKCNICGAISKVMPLGKLDGQINSCCFNSNSVSKVLDKPAKIYVLKLKFNGQHMYKLGVTTKDNIVGSGQNSRYSAKGDKKIIQSYTYALIDTLSDALDIERNFKYHSNSDNLRYNGKVSILKGMGNTEIFIKPISLKDLLSSTNYYKAEVKTYD